MPQNPYMEQQEPCGQLPQTVPAFAAPHVPSLVTTLVLGALVVGVPRTGSWVDDGAGARVVVGVQPLWHPLATEQLEFR